MFVKNCGVCLLFETFSIANVLPRQELQVVVMRRRSQVGFVVLCSGNGERPPNQRAVSSRRPVLRAFDLISLVYICEPLFGSLPAHDPGTKKRETARKMVSDDFRLVN